MEYISKMPKKKPFSVNYKVQSAQRAEKEGLETFANSKREKEGNRGRLGCLHELIIAGLER